MRGSNWNTGPRVLEIVLLIEQMSGGKESFRFEKHTLWLSGDLIQHSRLICDQYADGGAGLQTVIFV